MTGQRGWIFAEDAYAQGKMLNHGGWNGVLPRRITPSDVDMVFDNAGKIIFIELSSSCSCWQEITPGQRLLYENAIKGGAHCACLCKHSVPVSMQIDTRYDIDSFQIMVWDYGLVYSKIQPGAYWQQFVSNWFGKVNGPLFMRRKILGASAANGLADGGGRHETET
jgi:hypothetical protein